MKLNKVLVSAFRIFSTSEGKGHIKDTITRGKHWLNNAQDFMKSWMLKAVYGESVKEDTRRSKDMYKRSFNE